MLARSPFVGEGYRKAWARLRLAGVRTSKGRVLRLMRAAGLLAPTRVGCRRGPQNHDGTITTDRPDELWGTDATACLTTREGNATVFIAGDHCTQEYGGRQLDGAPPPLPGRPPSRVPVGRVTFCRPTGARRRLSSTSAWQCASRRSGATWSMNPKLTGFFVL